MDQLIQFAFNLTELYDHVSRKIIFFFATAGGLIGTSAPDSVTSPVESLAAPTWGDFARLFFHVLFSEDSIRILVGASIGGAVGSIWYIIMWPVKKYMFRRWPINDARAIKELKED